MNGRDTIHIDSIETEAIIGIYPHEREKKQKIRISLSLGIDLEPAGKTDSIDQTVDYHHLAKKVAERVESSSFFLIEALADEIAAICMDDRRVESARVRVEKPNAIAAARNVWVEIVRGRESR